MAIGSIDFTGQSLGWGVLRHAHKHLPSPSDPSEAITFTAEQVEIVLRWYAVNEEGEFLHRRGALEMPKGWGKSPLAAVIAIEEFAGPVLFDHWDGDQPVGRPWDNPIVEIAAVSEDQTDNTYSAIFGMLSANDGRASKSLGIDNGRTRLYLAGRPGVLRPVTAASGSREGARLTFAVMDETHLWLRRNGGVKLAGTLRRNAAKMGGRTLETTNAPLLGEKSIAEQSGLDAGVFHYARRPSKEPDPNWSDEQLIAALDETYGDASWIDRRRLVAEIRDPATSWDDALRFYFNWRTAGSGRAVDPRRWDELAKPRDVPDQTYLALGFDGSYSRDSSVLRACLPDGYAFTLGTWSRPIGNDMDAWRAAHPGQDWSVDRLDVDQVVEAAFKRYKVGRMFCDPFLWQTEVETWAERHGGTKPETAIVLKLETNQARRIAPPVDRWLTAIREGSHTHDGEEVVSAHVKAAHLERVRLADDPDDGRTKYRLIKGDDHAKIDGALADVLAFEAAMTMPEAPAKPKAPEFH